MKRLYTILLGLAFMLVSVQAALAHFGMVIPSKGVVEDKAGAALTFTLAFAHPMEMEGMNLVKPQQFKVKAGEEVVDLLGTLKEIKLMEHKAWKGAFTPKKPGVYSFFMVPEPYWEPAEDCFIQHLTKVVVPAFGDEDGWDEPVGLKAEIVPLTRPFGNYAGNIFSGVVLVDGKATPGVEVEVESYNSAKKRVAPNGHMNTQVVKTDANGVFSFVAPWSGWWGFAALTEAKETIKHAGQDKKIEVGAVLWMEFVDPKLKK